MLDDYRSNYERRIRALADFGHRGSTTDRERAAADYLCGELSSIGLNPEREAFNGTSSHGGRVLIHVLLAAIGAALFWITPAISVGIDLLVLFSLWLESTTRGVWLSRPLVRSTSTNIVARVQSKSPRMRVIVSGHYDTQRTGIIWWLSAHLLPLVWRLPPALKPPLLPLAFVILGQVVFSSLALAIESHRLLTIVNWYFLGVYALDIILFADWARGSFVPGASDNATGAAAVLTLGEIWRQHPIDDVELILLLPGCEESGMLGSAAWADRHRKELNELPTYFLNIDNLGVGPVRFFGAEIPLLGWPVAYPRAMVDVAKETARKLDLDDAGPHTMPGPGDGLSFLMRGLPGLTILSFRAHGYMPWYHRLGDTTTHLNFDAAWQGVLFGWAWREHLLSSKGKD